MIILFNFNTRGFGFSKNIIGLIMVFQKWLCVLVIIKIVSAQYQIPELKLEAFSPSGFRASLPTDENIKIFAFHGKVNEEIKQTEPGDFLGEGKQSTDGYWVYYNPHLKLNIGDEVNYWVFVQNSHFGYRRDNQKWKVTELLSNTTSTDCQVSKTVVTGRASVCNYTTVFEDQFSGNSLDANKWIIEQYIPDEPDYEFVIYKKDGTVIQTKNSRLIIKPKLQSEKDVYQATLDLTDGCTRPESKRSRCKSRMFLLHNPVVSGRIATKLFFSYVDIEIKAKLPSGDWMYPEIYLEDKNYNKLVIAYSRGNKVLTGNDGTDIGGSLLFGGPMLSSTEPARSEKLSSYRHPTEAFGDNFHEYRLKWTPDKIELFIDRDRYGFIDANTIKSSGFASNPPVQARLVLGIGVGGINDFPNDYMSGDVPKPWKNRNSVQVKAFYESRNQWLPSWNTGGQLQVDYVKIKSI